MTSQYRHRRTSSPTTAFPATIEPGEIAVNTANRQIAVGDAQSGLPLGQPLQLIGMRFFDARAQYALGDFVVQANNIYRAKALIAPGAFNASQWDLIGARDEGGYVLRDGTRAMTADLTLANSTPGAALSAASKGYVDAGLATKLALAGGTMTGPLILSGPPTAPNEAATKQFAESTVTGKVSITGDTMSGNLTIAKDTPAIILNKSNDNPAMIYSQKAGVIRWRTDYGAGAETGANNGSDFITYRYDDAGNNLGAAVNINRKTGNTVLGGALQAGDIYAVRTANSGFLGLGSNGTHAVQFDGTNYYMPAAPLYVNGYQTWTKGDFNYTPLNKAGDTMTGSLAIAAGYRLDLNDGPIEVRRPSQGGGYCAINGDGNPGMYSRNSNDGNMALAVLNAGGSAWPHSFYGNGQYSLSGYITSNMSQFSMQPAITTAGGCGVLVNGNNGGGPAVKYMLQANWASAGYSMMGLTAVYNPGVQAYWQFDVGGQIYQFSHDGQAYKSGGGGWGATSDARIKNVLGNYEHGLAEIRQLMPVRYTYKGNDTTEPPSSTPNVPNSTPTPTTQAPFANSPNYGVATAGKEFVGLIAQNAEAPMPEMVSVMPGFIDGTQVTDLRLLDTNPLLFALVNAVKELAARVEMLEAK